MSAHLGSWEMAAHPVGLYAEPMHVIGRPLDNPWLDRHLGSQRTRFGNATIPKRGAARGSLRVLRQGGIVGILIDQRVRPEEGILVPFFGHPALTSPLLGRLAIKTGAPIVPLFGHLAPHGTYRVEFEAPIDIGSGEEAAVEAITARCSTGRRGSDPFPARALAVAASTLEDVRRRRLGHDVKRPRAAVSPRPTPPRTGGRRSRPLVPARRRRR